MEEVFFSFTFGGEALSLAAAAATMRKLQREPVLETIAARGGALIDGVNGLIASSGCAGFLSTSGHPAWTFVAFSDGGGFTSWQIKTLFMQEMLSRGVLTYGTHNMNYSHSEADIDRTLEAADEALKVYRKALDEGVDRYLLGQSVKPVFRRYT
jgi:glutamate-1-semialdehyde 2,1-aminomutase